MAKKPKKRPSAAPEKSPRPRKRSSVSALAPSKSPRPTDAYAGAIRDDRENSRRKKAGTQTANDKLKDKRISKTSALTAIISMQRPGK